MQTTLNYIYNEKGLAEYVIIPVNLWEKLKSYLPKKAIDSDFTPPKFNPREYFGILADLNLDIEQELQNMRNEWNRDI